VTQQSALAFFTQPGIVCEACGRSHRRAPLKGACDCGASFVKTPIAAR
jgi:DNA polymerase II large subunit